MPFAEPFELESASAVNPSDVPRETPQEPQRPWTRKQDALHEVAVGYNMCARVGEWQLGQNSTGAGKGYDGHLLPGERNPGTRGQVQIPVSRPVTERG